MYYTTKDPEHQDDRIHLFPSPESAAAAHPGSCVVHQVAVLLDRGEHRVVPTWTDPRIFDSAWVAPAELLADGSLMVRAPIPTPLFEPNRWDDSGMGGRPLGVECGQAAYPESIEPRSV